MTNEWLVPSVEDASIQHQSAVRDLLLVTDIDACEDCCYSAATVEAASVQLDVANALASEERLRASVAW